MKKQKGIAGARVSTDKQWIEGDSLEVQMERIKRAADRDGVEIVEFFIEHYSGRKTDRVVIDDMLAFLDENPGIKWLYINEINRFSRGGGDIYLNLKNELTKRGVEIKDVSGVIQKSVNTLSHLDIDVEYDWSRVSPSRPAEVMQAEYAKQEVSGILTRMIGQEIRLAMQGYQIRKPDFGYRNIRIIRPDGKPVKIMEPIEPEASWVRKMFELRVEGGWTDDAICEHVNAMGFKTRKRNKRDKETGQVIGYLGENPLTPKHLRSYLANLVYCGVKMEAWTDNKPIKSKSPSLVSVSTWNKANQGTRRITENLDGTFEFEKNPSRKKISWRENTEFLLRHVVMCEKCRNPLWASKSTGKSGNRFGYFHCARGHKRISYSQGEFERTIGKYLQSIEYKPAFLGLFREVVLEVWMAKNKDQESETKLIDKQIFDLQLKRSNVFDRLLVSKSPAVLRMLEDEIEDIERAIKAAEKSRPSAWLTEQEIEAFFQLARRRLEHPVQIPRTAGTKAQIEAEWGTVFSALPTYEEIRSGTPQLSLIYRLSRKSQDDRERMVSDVSSHWNTLTAEIHFWLEAFGD